MPNAAPGIVPPGIDPLAWYQAQREQELSQALTQGALTPPQVQSYGPARSRISPLSGAAKLAEAMLANRAFRKSAATNAQVYGNLSQQFQEPGVDVQPSQPVNPPSSPDEQSVQPASGVTQPQFHVNPGGNLGIPGVDPYSAMRLYMEKPEEYAKLRMGPNDWQSLLRATGGNVELAQALAQAKAGKEGTITARGGNFVSGPGGTYLTPDPSRAEQYVRNPDGTFSAVPIGGSRDIAAGLAGAVKGAQEQNTPHYEQDPFHPGQVNTSYPPPPPSAAEGPTPLTPRQPAATAQPQVTPPPAAAPATPPAVAPPPAKKPTQYFTSPRTPNTAADLESQKKGAESGQNYADELAHNADTATRLRRGLAELKNLAGPAGVSISNDAKLKLGSILIAAGADPGWVSTSLHTDIGALTAAGKQTGSLALNSVHEMTSRGTNFDLSTFIGYNPRLDMSSPDGFRRAVQYIDGTVSDDIARQADFNKWKTGQSPADWKTGHTSRWLEKENEDIDAGRTISNRNFKTEDDARYAFRRGWIGEGDRITVGGKTGAWHGE